MKLSQVLKYDKAVLNGLSIITIVTLLTAIFSKLTSDSNIDIFFCSDTLYLPSLYKDLIVDKNSIWDWELNPAPNYFPDMLVYFLLMFITNDFVLVSFIFSILQYVLIGFLFIKIFKLIFPTASVYYNLLIYSLLSFFLLEFFFFTKDFYYVFFMIINSYHTGAFIISLLCIFLSFKYIFDKKITGLLVIFFLGFLMVVSDKLFMVLYSIPICLTCILMYKKIGIRTTLYFIGVIIAFTFPGLYVSKLLAKDSYGFNEHLGGVAKLDLIMAQFHIYFDQMLFNLKAFGIKAISLYLFILSVLLIVYVFFNSLKKQQNILIPFYALFSLIFTAVVICAPMAAGIYQNHACIRYSISPFYLAILNMAVFFFYCKKTPIIVVRGRFILLGMNLLLLTIGLSQLSFTGLKNYFNYYPENARLVDEWAEKENLKYGVANYWEAKKITMFSKKNVKVYAVFDNVDAYLHVANNRWFFDNMFNFVVLTGFEDQTLYGNRMKDITYLSNSAHFKLIKTRPFYYNRFSGTSVINTEIKDK